MNFEPPPLTYSSILSATTSGGPKATHCAHDRVVHASARDERRGQRLATLAGLREGKVDEGAEVIGGDLPAFTRRQRVDALHAHAELVRGDERRHPAVAEPGGAPLGRLALPADPDGRRVCQGLGSTRIRSSLKNSPWKVTSSSVQSMRITRMASSVRRPRSRNGTPEASNSRGSSTPTPTAGNRRPRESQSTVAISFAATTGVR